MIRCYFSTERIIIPYDGKQSLDIHFWLACVFDKNQGIILGRENHHEGIDPVSRVLDILTGGDTNIILTEI
ncbi:unnamed protein product [Rhizophagus irregularis]|uniref:Uncharacterized protein n=1 Tax=Rhizophagus irregularis TaxID=588596 RepID=A0A915ZSP7_9GLOM|nr:unnamed protein product [Rhizophagus irregularis]CAB5388373.1 unnamed protein product [Rhizophagus irregularis]